LTERGEGPQGGGEAAGRRQAGYAALTGIEQERRERQGGREAAKWGKRGTHLRQRVGGREGGERSRRWGK